MKLKFEEEIKKIKKCPGNNEKGELILFRCVENPLSENSFVPQAVLLKPKYKDYCIAWGLSVFKNLDSAKQTLNNLSKKKRSIYTNIAKGTINDTHGVKYSGSDKNHYTFFPSEDFDFLKSFEIINTDE